MRISFSAVNRMVEQRAARDKEYREKLARNQKPLLSMGRRMSDEALLEKLRSLHLDLDRATLGEWCRTSLSAEELARRLSRWPSLKLAGMDADWLWICLTVLWERWFPQQPSFEMIDDTMQAGYEKLHEDKAAACEIWLEAWRNILAVMASHSIETFDDFDDEFGGTHYVSNWVQDLSMHLWNAGLEDARHLRERIAVCEDALRRRRDEDTLWLQNFRSDLAEAWFELGETQKAASLFQGWLNEDPQWGWGWIRWAGCHTRRWGRKENRDLPEADRILRQALAVPDVGDRDEIQESLADLYRESGRETEAKAIEDERSASRDDAQRVEVTRTVSPTRIKTTLNFGEKGLPLDRLSDIPAMARHLPEGSHPVPRVGRNDPCPCGSGKKYKKCCARKPTSG